MPAPSVFAASSFSVPLACTLARGCQTLYDHSGAAFGDYLTATGCTPNGRSAPSSALNAYVGYMVSPPNTVVLMFEGLQNLRQVLGYLAMSEQQSPGGNFPGFGPGKANGYPLLTYNNYYQARIASILSGLVSSMSSVNLVLAGHSFGGNMAALCALEYACKTTVGGKPLAGVQVYMFGAPRLFDGTGAVAYYAKVPKHYALCLEQDPVPHAPKEGFTITQSNNGTFITTQRTGHPFASLTQCYQLNNDGAVGQVGPFLDITSSAQINALANIMSNTTLSPDHQIQNYYSALARGFALANIHQSKVAPQVALADALDEIPYDGGGASWETDISSVTMPALSSLVALPALPLGGSVNFSRQVVNVSGLPRRVLSLANNRGANWPVGDGRAHRQIKRILRLMDDVLTHDRKVANGQRAGTPTVTAEAVWSDEARNAFFGTQLLLSEVLSSH